MNPWQQLMQPINVRPGTALRQVPAPPRCVVKNGALTERLAAALIVTDTGVAGYPNVRLLPILVVDFAL